MEFKSTANYLRNPGARPKSPRSYLFTVDRLGRCYWAGITWTITPTVMRSINTWPITATSFYRLITGWESDTAIVFTIPYMRDREELPSTRTSLRAAGTYRRIKGQIRNESAYGADLTADS